jgi:hypothetical protein
MKVTWLLFPPKHALKQPNLHAGKVSLAETW